MHEATPRSNGVVRRPSDVVAAVTRYDLVLAAIPLAIAAGVLLGALPSIPEPLGVAGGGVVALTATMYALFGCPPVQPGGRNRPAGR